MSDLSRMTGVPWHTEKMVRAEGDDKRHRSRCVYFKGQANGGCKYYNEKCRGSAHCDKYCEKKENSNLEVAKNYDIKRKTESPKKEVYKGLKKLKIEDIHLDQDTLKSPLHEKDIKDKIEYYRNQGELERPIVVCWKNNQYFLVRGHIEYVVCKKLGLKEVPAEMGTDEELAQYEALRNVGTLVWHNKNSEVGEVIQAGIARVKIRFDSGVEKSYDIHKCIQMETLRPLKY